MAAIPRTTCLGLVPPGLSSCSALTHPLCPPDPLPPGCPSVHQDPCISAFLALLQRGLSQPHSIRPRPAACLLSAPCLFPALHFQNLPLLSWFTRDWLSLHGSPERVGFCSQVSGTSRPWPGTESTTVTELVTTDHLDTGLAGV